MIKLLFMKLKWLEIRRHFLIRVMTIIGLGAMAVSCNPSTGKSGNEEKKDTINATKPADSISKDTIVSTPAKDTTKKQSIKQTNKPQPQPTKYGVPEAMPTKYGVPANFQTKYGVPNNN